MRVLITTPVFPPSLGGPAVYVPSLARFLQERGHDVQVLAFTDAPPPPDLPFRVVSIPRMPLPLRYLWSFLRTARLAGRADVVYIQEHLALAPYLAARLRRRPTAIRVMVDGIWEIAFRLGLIRDDIHTFETKRYGVVVETMRRIQRGWWRGVDRIVAPSRFLKGVVEGYGIDPAKVRHIPNAYHGPTAFAEHRAEARRALELDGRDRILLTICRLVSWKGVGDLLRVVERLGAGHRLVVCGEGPERARLETLARDLGVTARVRFAGAVPHDRIARYIRAADVFVLNSRYEGLSHTLLEVMHLGCPIVASRAGGNPELIEDGGNGRLVTAGDQDGIERAVREILDDPARAARFVAASREVARGFRREDHLARVEALLEEVAARGRAPAGEGACRTTAFGRGARERVR